jgi:hypothetical protein
MAFDVNLLIAWRQLYCVFAGGDRRAVAGTDAIGGCEANGALIDRLSADGHVAADGYFAVAETASEYSHQQENCRWQADTDVAIG